MGYKCKLAILAALALVLIVLFMVVGANGNWDYILPSRGKKLFAIVLTGAAIAFATMVFQTLTNNRILTPSILGLDSLYMLLQTSFIFFLGSTSQALLNRELNFLLSVVMMVFFSFILYKLLFKREGPNDIYFLLLIGIICGTFFSSLSSFMQMVIDPNEFMTIQDRMFASFNNVNTDILGLSTLLLFLCSLYFLRFSKYLDILSLGRDHAVNLGVPYDHVVKRLLVIIFILIAIATALVGPITFLGLLVANVAHEFLKTYKHGILIIGSILISIIALVGGQFIVERIFTFSTTVSVIINFVGGIYFIYLLLRRNKEW